MLRFVCAKGVPSSAKAGPKSLLLAGSSTRVSTADSDALDGSRSCQHLLQKPSCRASAWGRSKRRQTALKVCSSLHRNGHEAGAHKAACFTEVSWHQLSSLHMTCLCNMSVSSSQSAWQHHTTWSRSRYLSCKLRCCSAPQVAGWLAAAAVCQRLC